MPWIYTGPPGPQPIPPMASGAVPTFYPPGVHYEIQVRDARIKELEEENIKLKLKLEMKQEDHKTMTKAMFIAMREGASFEYAVKPPASLRLGGCQGPQAAELDGGPGKEQGRKSKKHEDLGSLSSRAWQVPSMIDLGEEAGDRPPMHYFAGNDSYKGSQSNAGNGWGFMQDGASTEETRFGNIPVALETNTREDHRNTGVKTKNTAWSASVQDKFSGPRDVNGTTDQAEVKKATNGSEARLKPIGKGNSRCPRLFPETDEGEEVTSFPKYDEDAARKSQVINQELVDQVLAQHPVMEDLRNYSPKNVDAWYEQPYSPKNTGLEDGHVEQFSPKDIRGMAPSWERKASEDHKTTSTSTDPLARSPGDTSSDQQPPPLPDFDQEAAEFTKECAKIAANPYVTEEVMADHPIDRSSEDRSSQSKTEPEAHAAFMENVPRGPRSDYPQANHRGHDGRRREFMPLYFTYGIEYQPGPNEHNTRRTVVISDLPPQVDVADIVDRAGDAPILSIKLLPTLGMKYKTADGFAKIDTLTAIMTFFLDTSAEQFCFECEENPLVLRGRTARVQLITTPTYPYSAEEGIYSMAQGRLMSRRLKFRQPAIPADKFEDLLAGCDSYGYKTPGWIIDKTMKKKQGFNWVTLEFCSVDMARWAFKRLLHNECFMGSQPTWLYDHEERRPSKEKRISLKMRTDDDEELSEQEKFWTSDGPASAGAERDSGLATSKYALTVPEAKDDAKKPADSPPPGKVQLD